MVTLSFRLASIKSSGSPVELANGCREYSFLGDVLNEVGLHLKLVFRVAEDDPVVRFRYESRATALVNSPSPPGRDQINYLGLSLAGLPGGRFNCASGIQ